MRQQLSVAAAAICLAMMTCGCQTSPPKPDRAAESAPQAVESPEDEQDAPEDASTEDEPESKPSDDSSAPMPEEASLVIEVTPDVVMVDGDEILSLSDGYVGRNGFGSNYYFNIKGLVEPVEDALIVERRRRVVYGEEGSVGRALVKVDPTVPADTIFGLHYTLAATELTWLTLQVGDQAPVHTRLSADFIGRRLVPWRDRKPSSPEPKPERKPESKSNQSGGVVGGIGYGKQKTVLGSISGSGSLEVGRGSGGMGLRGVGRGGGGLGFAGLANAKSGLSNTKSDLSNDKPTRPRYRKAAHCDASAGAPAKPMVMPYANVQLFPKRFSTWLSDAERRHGSVMFQNVAVDADYPWWKIYNALADMRSHFGEADTLLIWPHPSLSSGILPKIARVNCKLPESSYASGEAWEAARAEVSECEPLFRTQMMSNGKTP